MILPSNDGDERREDQMEGTDHDEKLMIAALAAASIAGARSPPLPQPRVTVVATAAAMDGVARVGWPRLGAVAIKTATRATANTAPGSASRCADYYGHWTWKRVASATERSTPCALTPSHQTAAPEACLRGGFLFAIGQDHSTIGSERRSASAKRCRTRSAINGSMPIEGMIARTAVGLFGETGGRR